MLITKHSPAITGKRTGYGSQMRLVLVAAFALSASHTVYGYLTGIGDPSFTVTTPVAWVFYALGFTAAAVACVERRWVHIVLASYLVLALAVAVFYYPTTFVPRQQTTFGWFENDVYTGLLMIALFLDVQRLRSVTLHSGR